jgi:putative transposase
MSFWRLYYHLIWATKKREPLINDIAADVICRSIQAICSEQRVIVHAIGVMPDHVHLAVAIPPRISVSDFAKLVKGGASHLVNRSVEQPIGNWFFWQPEYGVLSFGVRSLESVVRYVGNKAFRHANDKLWPLFEQFIDDEFDRTSLQRSLEETL